MGILDVILILAVGAGFLAAVFSMIKNHRRGGCAGCCGNCASCLKTQKKQ